ncbi:hypothetical protein Taro_025544 [Colocasia esculenta]|uniref:Uncharacterized protein n=1 Tax=Colocasia esculenta TaxID=4460 RepID=A0A843VHV2_COLES|nr:hypothetical protein [Colocasia esculenta]
MSSRPNRSDAHLPPEEEARLTEETREYFDGIAPKRHSKPQRSEHSDRYSDALPPTDGAGIPELDRFRDLEVDTESLLRNVTLRSAQVEVFVEATNARRSSRDD